jgi:hypothetical protein
MVQSWPKARVPNNNGSAIKLAAIALEWKFFKADSLQQKTKIGKEAAFLSLSERKLNSYQSIVL